MNTKDFNITSEYDGLSIRLTVVEAEDCNGVVLINHGMAEHRKRYIPFIEYLAKNGFTVIAHDTRGHGKSIKDENDLGYFDAQGLISDIKQINALAQKSYPQKPIFLFGHSMGSLAVRAYTRLYDISINGLIVCGSPSYNAAAPIAKLLCKAIALFKGDRHRSKLIYNLSIGAYEKAYKNEGKLAWLCDNRDVQDLYENDELCGFKFTLKGYYALFSLMTDAYRKSNPGNPLLPVYFISGSNDPCLVNEKSFLKAVDNFKESYDNTSYTLYENERHEILNGSKKEQVYSDILAFINKALKERS